MTASPESSINIIDRNMGALLNARRDIDEQCDPGLADVAAAITSLIDTARATRAKLMESITQHGPMESADWDDMCALGLV